MKVSISVNEFVKVRLTDRGREIHRKNHEDVFGDNPISPFEYREPKTDEAGFSEFQLHELMRVFGDHMHMGMSRGVPFETEIIFESRLY